MLFSHNAEAVWSLLELLEWEQVHYEHQAPCLDPRTGYMNTTGGYRGPGDFDIHMDSEVLNLGSRSFKIAEVD